MDTKVKAVVDLMQTLGVSIDDVVKAVSAERGNEYISKPVSKERFEYGTTRHGLTYASFKGVVVGLVFDGVTVGRFVLAMHHSGYNKTYSVARYEARMLPRLAGKKWIVPSDEHLRVIKDVGVSNVNDALRDINSDELSREAYLSSTSQSNMPHHWVVRFVLPLD